MNIKLIETYLKKEVETLAGKGKEFIKNLSKYDSNKERLGGKRVLRPVDMTDGMMFIYDSTSDAFRAIIMPQGADVLFKDERPIPQSIGGYKAGDIINNVPLSEVVRTILFPYVAPRFTGFSITGIPVLQIGDTANTCTFNWGISDMKTVSANSIKISRNGSPILTGLNLSPVSMDLAITNDIPKKEIFVISALNTKGETFSMSTAIAWNIPIYYGVSPNENVTEDEVESMAEILVAELTSRTYSFMGPGYKYIAIPDNIINHALTFKDAITKFDVAMKEITNFQITHKSGITNTYTLFRSFYLLNGDITITIS